MSKQLLNKTALQLLSRLSLVLLITNLGACLQAPSGATTFHNNWQQEILEYKNTLESSHPDSLQSVLSLSSELRQEIISLFSNNSIKQRTAKDLALWLISEQGHGMRYDVDANLTPLEAFQQKKGNCLSFTLLFSSLAAELGIEIQFNLVDIPDVWSINDDNSIILYRHINGVLELNGKRSVYDLALDLYDTRYPQKIISQIDAVAQLHSNKAINELENGNYPAALHFIKLAISLSPENEDLWINHGVIVNRLGNLDLAEQSFLQAYSLNSKHTVAANTLEQFYMSSEQPIKAKKYRVAALKARENNPYYLFETAKSDYQSERFRQARSRINKAIRIHPNDFRFYELSSRISQKLERYDLALKDVLMAHQLSQEVNDQSRFASKAKLISKLVPEQKLQQLLDE